MSNPELENFLSGVVTALSQARCRLAGRPESYTDPNLIEGDNCIGQAQLYLRRAVLALGESRDLEPDVENAMTQFVVGIV